MEDSYSVVGKSTRQRFRLGDKVKIVVKKANLEQKLLDYSLVWDESYNKGGSSRVTSRRNGVPKVGASRGKDRSRRTIVDMAEEQAHQIAPTKPSKAKSLKKDEKPTKSEKPKRDSIKADKVKADKPQKEKREKVEKPKSDKPKTGKQPKVDKTKADKPKRTQENKVKKEPFYSIFFKKKPNQE